MPGSRVAVLQSAVFGSMLVSHVAAASGARITRDSFAPLSGSGAQRMQVIAVRVGSVQAAPGQTAQGQAAQGQTAQGQTAPGHAEAGRPAPERPTLEQPTLEQPAPGLASDPGAAEQLLVEVDQAFLALHPGCEVRVLHDCELLVIDAPIELAQQVMGQHISRWGARLDGNSQLLHPTVAFAGQLLRGDRRAEASSLGDYYVERLLQEMLIGLIVDGLLDRRHRSAAPTAPDVYRLALAVILARGSDPTLTTDAIAEEVHLSRRQLERLFQRHDTSVAAEVRRARVAVAVSMLQDEQYLALSIDQIGQFVGLSGGSSLARIMAAEGHASPSVLRKRIGAA